jgi:hypothetical protein
MREFTQASRPRFPRPSHRLKPVGYEATGYEEDGDSIHP